MKTDQSLPKSERLCHRKKIQELFSKGSSLFVYPFKIHYLVVPNKKDTFPEVVFVVPKKFQKKAHQRNLCKRRIREAYRLQKARCLPLPLHLDAFALVYVGHTILSYDALYKKIAYILHQLNTLTSQIKEA